MSGSGDERSPSQVARAVPAIPRARSRRRILVARVVAIAADSIQFVALPLFLPGAASPWEDALDVVVGLTLVALLGWHWAFLPAFASELVPGLDLFPTWTAAVLFATRGRRGQPAD